MKRRLTFLAIPILAAALHVAPARAQNIDSPYRFLDHSQFAGLFGGYVAANEGRIDIGPQPAAYFGASWSMRISGPFAVAVDVAYMPTTRIVRDTVFVAADSMYQEVGEADVSLITAMASLRFNLTGARTWNHLQPFVIAGAGAALDVASGSAADEDLPSNARFDFGTSFAGQLGAGVDWFPTSRVSVRLDARNLLWKVPVPEAFLFTENGRTFPRSDWEQNFALTAGLSLHF